MFKATLFTACLLCASTLAKTHVSARPKTPLRFPNEDFFREVNSERRQAGNWDSGNDRLGKMVARILQDLNSERELRQLSSSNQDSQNDNKLEVVRPVGKDASVKRQHNILDDLSRLHGSLMFPVNTKSDRSLSKISKDSLSAINEAQENIGAKKARSGESLHSSVATRENSLDDRFEDMMVWDLPFSRQAVNRRSWRSPPWKRDHDVLMTTEDFLKRDDPWSRFDDKRSADNFFDLESFYLPTLPETDSDLERNLNRREDLLWFLDEPEPVDRGADQLDNEFKTSSYVKKSIYGKSIRPKIEDTQLDKKTAVLPSASRRASFKKHASFIDNLFAEAGEFQQVLDGKRTIAKLYDPFDGEFKQSLNDKRDNINIGNKLDNWFDGGSEFKQLMPDKRENAGIENAIYEWFPGRRKSMNGKRDNGEMENAIENWFGDRQLDKPMNGKRDSVEIENAMFDWFPVRRQVKQSMNGKRDNGEIENAIFVWFPVKRQVKQSMNGKRGNREIENAIFDWFQVKRQVKQSMNGRRDNVEIENAIDNWFDGRQSKQPLDGKRDNVQLENDNARGNWFDGSRHFKQSMNGKRDNTDIANAIDNLYDEQFKQQMNDKRDIVKLQDDIDNLLKEGNGLKQPLNGKRDSWDSESDLNRRGIWYLYNGER